MTWVQISRIVREHKDETVNIFSNKSYTQFFSYYKKNQNSTFLAFAKIVNGIFLSLSENYYFYQILKLSDGVVRLVFMNLAF